MPSTTSCRFVIRTKGRLKNSREHFILKKGSLTYNPYFDNNSGGIEEKGNIIVVEYFFLVCFEQTSYSRQTNEWMKERAIEAIFFQDLS